MATDVERLVVSLEASITKYERAMNKALGQTNKTMRDIERKTDQSMTRVESRFSRMGKSVGTTFATLQRGLVGAFAGVAAVRGAQQLIDASTRIENSLKVAGLAGTELTRVYDDLFDSAQRNAAPLEALTELYGRAALVQNELGVSTQELLGFTDNIAVALRVSGKSAAESSGALLQLSQALGSGIVRAEEFNSILEGALPVAQAAAAGLEEAGGSVARLRQLVVDGKVSSEAFFRAFEAGAVILQEKVANAELTVSQQFVRLQNVLIDTAGKFDDVTGAGGGAGDVIGRLATEIEAFGNYLIEIQEPIQGFLDFLGQVDQFGGGFSGLMDRILPQNIAERASQTSEEINGVSAEIAFLQQQALEAEGAVGQFIDRFRESDVFDRLPQSIQDAFNQIKQDLDNGELEAQETLDALNALGSANPDFGNLIGRLAEVVGVLRNARAEAAATINTVNAAVGSGLVATRPWKADEIGGQPTPGEYDPNVAPAPTVTPVSLASYPVSGGSGSGGSGSGSGGSGGGGSASQNDYERQREQYQERLRQMEMEIQLQQRLNPLVNDYGFAMEQARAQMELENAAVEAGLTLSPQRRSEIEQLSTAYATATANAARLSEQQDLLVQTFDDLQSAGRSALESIVQGFIEGQSAGEIFQNVLSQLATSLLNIGLNSLFGGFGGIFGGGGLPGFATGTANTGGARGQVRGVVHGQEAVIPLPNGGRVPVQIQGGGQDGSSSPIPIEIFVSPTGEFDARVGSVVDRRATVIVTQSIKQNNKRMPALMADMQQRE